MTRFLNGPAAGKSLELKRAPLFLRVVSEDGGKMHFDALDLLADSPKSTETIWVYRLTGEVTNVHLDYTDRKTGRRRGKNLACAEYQILPDQPADEVLRDNQKWQAWCIATHAKETK